MMGNRKQPTPPPADAVKPDPPPAPPAKTLLGLPVVEVDDMPEGEIRFGYPLGVQPVRVRPAVARTPTDPMRFLMEAMTDEDLADYARYHPTLTDFVDRIRRARRET